MRFLLSTKSQITKSTHLKRYIGYNICTHKEYPLLLHILLVLSITPPQNLRHSLYRFRDYYKYYNLTYEEYKSLEVTFGQFISTHEEYRPSNLSFIRLKDLMNGKVATRHNMSTQKECPSRNNPFSFFTILTNIKVSTRHFIFAFGRVSTVKFLIFIHSLCV